MIKHWAKLSCLVMCSQLVAVACTSEDDDEETTATVSTTTSSTTASGGSGGDGGTAGTGGNGGSAGDATSNTTAASTTASGGTSSGGNAGAAGDGNEAGSAGAAGASTDGYDGEQISELAGPETVTNGGTFTIQATIPGADGDQTFQVAVNGEAGDNVTATPNDDGVFDISFTVPGDATGDSVTVSVTPLDSDGDAGLTRDIDFDLVETGTGDVKVTLSFDQDVDLDLSVIEPGGFEIYYDQPESPAGGQLDLDSNAECVIDGKNIENIFWPTDAAPEGEYEVGVSYFEACVAETVNFTVTITVGDEVQTMTGSFDPEEADPQTVFSVGTFTVD